MSVHTHKCLSSLKHVCHSSENPRLSTKMPCARQIFPEKYMLAYKNALLTLTSAFSATVSALFYQKILSIKSTHLHSRMTVSTKNNSSKYKNVSSALKMSFGTTKYRSMHQNPFQHTKVPHSATKMSVCTHKCLSTLKFVCHP